MIGACSAQAATSSSTHVILQMGDGRFYDPASGRSAPTREELLGEPPVSPPINVLGSGPSGTPSFLPVGATSTAIIPDGVSGTTTATTTPALPDSRLIQAVARGKALLVGQKISSTTKATTDQSWRVVHLAVWTPETDQLVMVRVKKKGSSVTVIDPGDFTVQVRTASSLNSTYDITSKSNPSYTPVVVAVRYPLYHPVVSGKKTTYTIEEVIYTPYARDLHTPEVIARGKAYLDQQVDDIYNELQEKKVASISYPQKLVTEVVRPEVAKAILLIEHTDQTSLKNNPQNTLEAFYTELGLNERLTYAYEESPVGASGAPQFMPATYKLLTKQTILELDPDFTRGMRDLDNSMKAQVVYLDRILSVMPDAVQEAYLTQPYEAGAYVVASYNAGEVRIKRAVQAWGDDWDTTHSGQVTTLQKKQKTLTTQVTNLKAKLKTKAVKASVAKTTAAKKELATAQANLNVVNSQIDALQKSSLRPETFYYLQKYRTILPYIAETAVAPVSTSTDAIVQASSVR